MDTEQDYPYTTHLNVLYEPLKVVDVPALVAGCTDRWYNQTLSRVNDSVVRLGVVEGEYHWHKHDDEDEFFYLVEGRFIIDWRIAQLSCHRVKHSSSRKGSFTVRARQKER
jgi:mannose-6-phosphate isomerase-like protein (cupin superfamily)